MKIIFTFLNDFKLGILKGVQTPTLPDYIIKFQSHPFIRIFRVLGGISTLSLITKTIKNLNAFFLYVAIFLTILFLVYSFYISYHRIKHIYNTIQKKDLEVRNSPLNKFAIKTSQILFCLKGFCEITAPVGVTFGILAGADSLLEHKGKNPVFLPYIADFIIPDTEEGKLIKERKDLFKTLNKFDKDFKNFNEESLIIKHLEDSSLFSDKDIYELKNDLENLQNELLINKDKCIEEIKINTSKHTKN